MWELILKDVDDFETRWNCFKTCQLFQTLIDKRPAQILLPVVSLFAQYFTLTYLRSKYL